MHSLPTVPAYADAILAGLTSRVLRIHFAQVTRTKRKVNMLRLACCSVDMPEATLNYDLGCGDGQRETAITIISKSSLEGP